MPNVPLVHIKNDAYNITFYEQLKKNVLFIMHDLTSPSPIPTMTYNQKDIVFTDYSGLVI